MVVGRDRRRAERRALLAASFAERHLEAALDVLALMDLAWHDCYGAVEPPAEVLDDVLVLAEGDLAALVRSAHLAVVDFRDARVAADAKRAETSR